MKHVLLLAFSTASCSLAGSHADRNTAPARPNVLIIYTDDVGYGDVGCYEGSKTPTPNIDRLALEGIRFTDAHCSAATCTPSRYALLTGRYAFRKQGTGIASGDAGMVIDAETTTVADLLKSAGYTTGVVGKWHLGLGAGKNDWNQEVSPNPSDLGFDDHFLMPATGDRVPCVYFEDGYVVGLDPDDPSDDIRVSYGKRIDDTPSGKEARDTLKMNWSHGHNKTIVNGISRIGWMSGGEKARWVDEDMADVFTEKALEFLEYASASKQDQPWFLFFSTHDIHVPRVPHPRFAGQSGQGPRGDAMVQADDSVGRLLDFLDEKGLAENTLVIFASDNGPVLDDGYADEANEKLGDHDPNGPWRAGKYSMFEGGTRTPFLVRWPERIRNAGRTSAALFGQIDLAHSLARLVGAELPEGACADSRDELDTLLGEDAVGRPHLIHEAWGLAVRQGRWKYVPAGKTRERLGPWDGVKVDEPGVLYDTQEDPGETRDLAGTHPKKLSELRDLLEQIRIESDGGRDVTSR